jgi:SAM-dependent methyltransferase
LFLADGCFMPFKERAFQTVFSNCVIEHIPDLDKLLSEVSRVLNKGGKFIFTVPSDKFGEYLLFSVLFRNIGLATLAKSYATFRNRTLCHFHCFSHDIWVDRLKKYNLKTINYAYYMPKRSTMFWDFLAAAIFLFNRLGASKNIERRLTLIFKKKLHKYANLDNERGAGLLIVASKI